VCLCAQQHMLSPQEHSSTSLCGQLTFEELRPLSLANGPPLMASVCGMHGVQLLQGICASISVQVIIMGSQCTYGMFRSCGHKQLCGYILLLLMHVSGESLHVHLCAQQHMSSPQEHSLTLLHGWLMLEEVRPLALANRLPMVSAWITLACMVCHTCRHICASIVACVVVMGQHTCGMFRSHGCKL
jgi:hypothetical protein